MDIPDDLLEALRAGDPVAELFVRQVVEAAGETCVDRQLEEDWDDVARARTPFGDGHDDD